MRSDMAKVIVERPRWGAALRGKKKGYRKALQKSEIADLPRREPLAGRWRGMSKCFSEHLSPMRRFLRSRVGRPWDKVHQELCANVDFGNIVQKHVMTHIYQYVARYVEEIDGRLFSAKGYGRAWPLTEGQMYVCPRTGILRTVKQSRTRITPKRICRTSMLQFHFRDGGWWELQLRELPPIQSEQWDVWLEKPIVKITSGERESAYGAKRWAISKKLLTPCESRALLKLIRQSK